VACCTKGVFSVCVEWVLHVRVELVLCKNTLLWLLEPQWNMCVLLVAKGVLLLRCKYCRGILEGWYLPCTVACRKVDIGRKGCCNNLWLGEIVCNWMFWIVEF